MIDSGRPTQGLPASNAALAARPRWAVVGRPRPPRTYFPQQCLYFFPLPQGQGSLRPFPAAPSAAGAPFYFIDSGRPTQGLPASDAALAARPRWAVAASPPKRERAAGAVQERTRQGDNRGISAEMQCGTASRAARDLTGEPCSPVNPFFLDGGFWLGESASRKPGGGVGGAFYASGGTGGFVTPRRFFSGIARRHHLFLKKRWWGRPSFRPEGGISCPAPCAELLFPAWDHAPRSRGNPAVQ